MRPRHLLLPVIVLSLAVSLPLVAQEYSSPETGEKALGTYFATDIDSVNLSNGNLHLHIPLFSLSGREIPASLALDYDSNAYEPRVWGYDYTFEFMQWKKSSSLQMGRLNLPTREPNYIPANNGGPYTILYTVTITWGPSNGSRYTFRGQKNQSCTSIVNYVCQNPSPTNATFYDNMTMETEDSEFVQLTTGTYFSNGSTAAYITFKDGSRFQVQASGTPLVTSTNGNFLTPNTSSQSYTSYSTALGDYVPGTDTVGRTIGYNKTGQNETITLLDANGQSQIYQIVWKTTHAYNQQEPPYGGHNMVLDQDIYYVLDYLQLPNGKRYTMTYNSEGMVSKVTLPSGAHIRYEYEHLTCGLRARVVRRFISADGTSGTEKQTTYSYNSANYTTISCPGIGTMNTATGALLSTTVTDPTGGKVQHIFDTATARGVSIVTMSSTNQVLKRIDKTWSTGNNPQVSSVIETMPDMVRKTAFIYDSYNNVTRQEDFDWGLQAPGSRLRYVDRTYLTSACTSGHVCGRVTSEKIYTDGGTLVAQTDYEYDDYGNYSCGGNSYSNALFSRSGTIPGWLSPTGTRANVTAVKKWITGTTFLITKQQYDVLGNLVKVTDPGCHTSSTEFTDRFSGITGTNTFAFPTRVTDLSGFYVDTTYDFNSGVVTQTTDSLNRTITKTYDVMNRELQTTFPNGSFTRFTYNDTALTAKKEVKVDSAGNLGTMIAHYDGLYRKIQNEIYDAEGTIYVDTQYDAQGRKWKVSNPRRSSETAVWTQFEYDALDRSTVTTSPDNSSVHYAHVGNQMTTTDQTGSQRRYTYDGLHRMTKVEEPYPSLATPLVTTYTYNVLGKMIQSNQNNQTRSWEFDALARITSETSPESGTTTFAYNSEGLLATKTDARNITTTVTYHSTQVHQIGSRSYSDSTPTVTLNYGSQGLRSSMSDGLGSVSYSYDSNTDRLTQESRTLTGVTGTFSTSYVYNLKGDLTSMTYPSGRVMNFNYATGGGCCNPRLSSIVDQTTSTTIANGMTFNATGEWLTRTLNPGANALNHNFTYNNRLELTQATSGIGSTTVMNVSYNYGTSVTNTGRVLSRTDAIQPEHSMVYRYDSLYRLSQAISQDSSWDISWAFDVWGNRTSQTPRGLATSKVGTQTSGYSNNRDTSYSYDSAGNQTNDGNHNYTFNAENKITQMDGGSAVYGYDGEGRRMKKSLGSETTFYFYGPWGLLCEFTNSNSVSGATTATNTDKSFYYSHDNLGTTILVMNSNGTILENNRVLPYGESWQSDLASINDKKFTTYERDQNSALDYAMDRFYPAFAGRYNSADRAAPHLDWPQSLNRYSYGFNHPLNVTDPSGKDPCEDAMRVLGMTPVPCSVTVTATAYGEEIPFDPSDVRFMSGSTQYPYTVTVHTPVCGDVELSAGGSIAAECFIESPPADPQLDRLSRGGTPTGECPPGTTKTGDGPLYYCRTPPPLTGTPFTGVQSALLRSLFGRNSVGAAAKLTALLAGGRPPDGLTAELLLQYRNEVAVKVLESATASLTSKTTQRVRLHIIDYVLKNFFQ